MKKALVLTRCWSDEPETATHGIFQRFSLFLDALCAHVDAIEIMAFAPFSEGMPALAARHAAQYQIGRSARITVTAVARRPNPPAWSFIQRYLKPALWVDSQENYLNMASEPCIEAVRMALRSAPALVFAHRLPVFTPLLKLNKDTLPPILFDMDDIEHKALIRGLLFAPRWQSERLRLLQTPALMLRERAAVRASRHTFVCSQEDANLLQRISGSSCVSAVPNAVAAPADLPIRATAGNTFGFIGSFAHPPNLDAATWLIEDIWPRIRKVHPDANLKIAGAGSGVALAHYAGTPGLTVLDFVPDVGSFYNDVTVVLAPLRFGAGTRVKIIEAAGYGLPTISTGIGAEGLVFKPEEEIVLAESAEQIASRACRLLSDHAAALRIGRAARACYKKQYGRQNAVESISGHVARILKTPTVR